MADAVNGLRARGARSALWLLALLLLAMTWALVAPGKAPGASRPAPDLSPYPWIYLRDGQPPQAGSAAVSLIAVGDVMPGRGVAGQEDPLRQVAPLLREADLALGNLEAVLAPEGDSRQDDGRILLAAPAMATGWLQDAGFDLLSLANNHSLDFGAAGLAGTVGRLQAVGITPLGAGGGEEADAPLIKEVRGVRLAFLAFNAVPDPHPGSAPGSWQPAQWDQAPAVAAVSAARRRANAVIVFLHWGQEYALHAAPWQREAAQALVEAGADLVLGHHPHVVQEWALLRNGSALAAFSLGNFLFDQEGACTGQGLALRVLFDQRGLSAVQVLPLWAGLQPRLMAPQEAAPLLVRIAPAAARQAFACDEAGCHSTEQAPAQDGHTEGIFWSGSIDLTGDGEPERVRRVAQRVHVYEGTEEVWVSPPQWRVVDVALGDPNDDGRGELLLALWQEDAQGHARSQPFIVGHRGGQYKVLWGGRPVTAPISEVALGDVDGDGTQELLVLEEGRQEAPGQEGRQEAPGQEGRQEAPGDEAGASLATLTIWRWQGWNFSLFWRSAPGAYADLRLAPGVGDAWLVTVAAN